MLVFESNVVLYSFYLFLALNLTFCSNLGIQINATP